MYLFYSLGLFLALVVYIPIYFFKLRILKGQSLCLSHRLGIRLPAKIPTGKAIWIHAVSVGEVLSLQNLTKQIKTRHPDWGIYFSSLTNTGLGIAKEKLNFVDSIFFIPFDFKCISRRFFRRLEPDVFILAESEFWPNILRTAKKRTRGVVLVNGRISKTSWKRYSRLKLFARSILSHVDRFLVQTGVDKERLESIGINPNLIQVAGNLKAEIDLPILSEDRIETLRSEMSIPESVRIAVAGSTRNGEEEKLFNAFFAAKQKRQDLRLILAPRHVERSREVERLGRALSLKVMRRSQLSDQEDWEVLILDTIGELALFYALADLAFIGGSLIPWGGQNLLEPAFYSKPIFFGKYMDNFSYLAEIFERSGAARVVTSEEELQDMFLMSDEDGLEKMGKEAWKILQSLQGATEVAIETIENMVSRA